MDISMARAADLQIEIVASTHYDHKALNREL